MSDTDTDALSRYARDRDADAFAQLVDRHGPMVYATCLRRLGDEWGARDAAQETFVKLARSAEAIHGSVGAWLHRCATTTAVDLIRKDARRRRRETQAPARDAEALAPWDDVRVALDEALLELPDATRELILQRYYRGRKLADLADEAGVSESLMSRRIKAAVDHLRDKLAIKGFGVTAAALTAGLAAESAMAMPAGLAAGLTGVGLAGVGQASGGVAAGLLATTQAKLAAGLVLAAAIVGGGVTYQVLWPSNTAAVSAASTTVQPVANQRIIKVPWPELSQGDMQHNLVIRPDDVIRVPNPERIAELDLLANVTDVRPEDLLPSQAESRLQRGDRISVAIFELLNIDQDFRTEHTIDANGEIELFSLGVVKAAGMTATQLERQIAGRLQERELLRNAQVTVSLLSMPTYSVVTNQPIAGFFTGVSGITRPDYRLLEAIELAGDLPDTVPLVLVIRHEYAGVKAVTLEPFEFDPRWTGTWVMRAENEAGEPRPDVFGDTMRETRITFQAARYSVESADGSQAKVFHLIQEGVEPGVASLRQVLVESTDPASTLGESLPFFFRQGVVDGDRIELGLVGGIPPDPDAASLYLERLLSPQASE
ncbi:MAG: sigma-70 family RNA polymerase sigma factor [Planctomycetota bacterium]